MQETDVSQRMTMDLSLNQMTSPTAAAAPDVVVLLEQMSTPPGTPCAAVDLECIFFSMPVNRDHQR